MPTEHPLRAYRSTHDLTCADLAKKLGIAEPTVRSFENGHRIISAEMAVTIEDRLGIPRYKIRADLWPEQAAA